MNLADFEIGYDRDYVGVELHCLRCGPPLSVASVNSASEFDLNGLTLDFIVEEARLHNSEVHGDLT